jgi:membrane-associated PAP2 superfamily phosphatase
MNRTGLIAALAIAAVVGLLFGIYPHLDIRVTGLLFNPEFYTFNMRQTLSPVRDAAMWLITVLAVLPVIAVVVKLILPHRPMLMRPRAILFLIVTLALGPGLVVNGLAKEHWGRPRPIEVQQMGGTHPFVAWWDPRGTCDKNCSFVSGDVSGGFWTLAPAALTPAPWRPLAYAGAIVLGSGIAVLRMLFGGHFFTDAVFAGVITFLIVWLGYNILYRWQPARFSDEAMERALERLARPHFLFPPQAPRSPQPDPAVPGAPATGAQIDTARREGPHRLKLSDSGGRNPS